MALETSTSTSCSRALASSNALGTAEPWLGGQQLDAAAGAMPLLLNPDTGFGKMPTGVTPARQSTVVISELIAIRIERRRRFVASEESIYPPTRFDRARFDF